MGRFQLPVVKSGLPPLGAGDLFRLTMRVEEIFDATLGERVPVEFGTAIVSPDFPALMGGNYVNNVEPPADRTAESVVGEVDALFAARGMRCYCWCFSGGRTPEGYRAVLEPRGYGLDRVNLWVLRQAQGLQTRDDLTIIPGRASFEKLGELAMNNKAGVEREQYRNAAIRRLDDTQVDNLLALDGTEPVGTLYFITSGEIGFIKQFYVLPSHQRQRVGATLLMRAVELAMRSRVKYLTLFCDDGNARAEALYRKAGFENVMQVDGMVWGKKATG